MDMDDYCADVGDRIRAERHARGWTQVQLAARTGSTHKAIRIIEDGTGPMRLRDLAAIAAQFDTTVAELLGPDWTPPPPPAPTVTLTPRQAAILTLVLNGATLAEAAHRTGTPRPSASSRLSEAYRILGVSALHGDHRREAARREAHRLNLIPPQHISCPGPA